MATFRPKENARPEFLLMVMDSWTYNRMTVDEKSACLDKIITTTIKGRFLQRWTQLQAVFSAYLDSIGYSGAGWRDLQNAPTEPETSEGKEDTTTNKTEPQEGTETARTTADDTTTAGSDTDQTEATQDEEKTIRTGARLYSHPHRHMVIVEGLQGELVRVIYKGCLYLVCSSDLYTDETETTPAILPAEPEEATTEAAQPAAVIPMENDTTSATETTQEAPQTAGTSEGGSTTTPPHTEPPRTTERAAGSVSQSDRRTRPAAPQSHGTTKGIQRHHRPPKTAYRATQSAPARYHTTSRGSPKICISYGCCEYGQNMNGQITPHPIF